MIPKNLKRLIVVLCTTFTCSSTIALASTASEQASTNILALDAAMMPIYSTELTKFQTHLMQTTPIIVARFSNNGGHFVLYRPGKDPLTATEPPVSYNLAKSIGHSALVGYEISASYLNTSKTDLSWRLPMQQFQMKIATALQTLPALQASDSDKQTFKTSLERINNYLNKCLSQGYIDKADLDNFSKQFNPEISKLIQISATSQVSHWMAVLAQWKELLGKDWDKTYALTNTLYVTRQNNIIFSVLAQFMGKDAINHRLFLFETTTFTTTDSDLLNLWARVLSDRAMSQVMLGDYYAMDSELLNNGGRQIIINEANKYNLPIILPKEEPFNSTAWPWRHNPNSGTGPANMSEIK